MDERHTWPIIFAKVLTLVTIYWTLIVLVILDREALGDLAGKYATMLAFCSVMIVCPILPTSLKGSGSERLGVYAPHVLQKHLRYGLPSGFQKKHQIINKNHVFSSGTMSRKGFLSNPVGNSTPGNTAYFRDF
jgi:hypothetical protein